MKEIAIVILNWNGAAMLQQFLPGVLTHSPEAEVVVADNASTDDSLSVLAEKFPQVRVIRLDRNYGFAEGYNRALRQVESPYYLLLNSDVEVTDGWLQPLLDYMRHRPQVAACQPKLRCQWAPELLEYAGAAGGFIDSLGYPFCRGRLFGTVERDEGQYDTVVPVFWASGAALMVRREAYWQVGGLDARFFAHQEEIDLCWRLRARGNGIVCIPQSVVYHVGGGTLSQESPRKTYLNFRNNLLLLYKNLPDGEYHRVMRWRFVLDALASLQFLAKGKWRNFLAVWQGRRDFSRMQHQFEKDRHVNLSHTVLNSIPERYAGSLLWQYYIKGKKTWKQLYT